MVISPDKDILFEQRVTKLRYLEVKASYHNSQSGSVLIVGAKGIYRFSLAVRVPEVQNRKGTESRQEGPCCVVIGIPPGLPHKEFWGKPLGGLTDPNLGSVGESRLPYV